MLYVYGSKVNNILLQCSSIDREINTDRTMSVTVIKTGRRIFRSFRNKKE